MLHDRVSSIRRMIGWFSCLIFQLIFGYHDLMQDRALVINELLRKIFKPIPSARIGHADRCITVQCSKGRFRLLLWDDLVKFVDIDGAIVVTCHEARGIWGKDNGREAMVQHRMRDTRIKSTSIGIFVCNLRKFYEWKTDVASLTLNIANPTLQCDRH